MNKLLLFFVFASICATAFGATYDNTKGNVEFRQAVNAALAAYKTANPGLAATVTKWYGNANIAAADTCAGATFPATPTTNGTLAHIVATRTINVCAFFSEPNRFTNSTNSVIGFDVEVLNEIAARLTSQYPAATPITINNINTPFADLLNQLAAGTCDLASGGFFITADRLKSYAFSCNITSGAFAALTNTSTAASYTTIDAISAANLTVGVLNPSTQFTFISTAYPTLKIVSVSTTADAVGLINNGTIAAWVSSQTTVGYAAAHNAGLAATAAFGPVNNVGYAMRYDGAATGSTSGTTGTAATTGGAGGATTGQAGSGSGSTTNTAAAVIVAYAAVVAAIVALLF